jgi:hypothetical protein
VGVGSKERVRSKGRVESKDRKEGILLYFKVSVHTVIITEEEKQKKTKSIKRYICAAQH